MNNQKKQELAFEVAKLQGDLTYNRIDHVTHANKMQEIYNEAKIYAIGVNELLSDVMQNGTQYEKQLEKMYKQQYSSDFKPAA